MRVQNEFLNFRWREDGKEQRREKRKTDIVERGGGEETNLWDSFKSSN